VVWGDRASHYVAVFMAMTELHPSIKKGQAYEQACPFHNMGTIEVGIERENERTKLNGRHLR